MEYIARAEAFARSHGLSLHLDGARVFNAVVKLGLELVDTTRHFDSVSICLSKGLGAPVGSVLLGRSDFIATARRWRKVTGGGMRQAGILAAAGLHALDHNIKRLADDHANAKKLADGLRDVPGFELVEAPQTNMVFLHVTGANPKTVAEKLRARGIVVSPAPVLRLVTHLDINDTDIDSILDAFRGLSRS